MSVRGEAGERARCDIANGSILRITRYGLTAYRVSDKKKKKRFIILFVSARAMRALFYICTTRYRDLLLMPPILYVMKDRHLNRGYIRIGQRERDVASMGN